MLRSGSQAGASAQAYSQARVVGGASLRRKEARFSDSRLGRRKLENPRLRASAPWAPMAADRMTVTHKQLFIAPSIPIRVDQVVDAHATGAPALHKRNMGEHNRASERTKPCQCDGMTMHQSMDRARF